MRVIAGTARSLPLKTPEGMDTRPTTDRIKETLFNMLQTRIGGSVFVDMFSGSGGIGIEAISRGARMKCFLYFPCAAIVPMNTSWAYCSTSENLIINFNKYFTHFICLLNFRHFLKNY